MQTDIYYKAMLARDYRFDGKFFVGVKTTGIYCRPICPAKPKKQNVTFFSTAQAAEKEGYRPCLRCCPESAPLSPAWIGKNAIVNRALRYISCGEYVEFNENEFAGKFGVSARHLRRLFQKELGLTPKQIFSTQRLNFARKLVVETNIAITEIAFISNFSSIRQFNTAFKQRFSKSPKDVRKNKQQNSANIKLFLSYRPPFDWDSLMQFYKSHEIQGIDCVENNSYTRVFEIDGQVGSLRLSSVPKKKVLLLEIHGNVTKILYKIVSNVRQMFDLDSDPLLIANTFETCKIMNSIYQKHPGMRIPRCWDSFETAICTILGQMVSTEQARRLVHQLVSQYGSESMHPETGKSIRLFPRPENLTKQTLEELKTTKARKETIKELARLIHEEKISLFPTQDPHVFKQNLLKIKGIGSWTAEYVALRVLGDTNAFPDKDLILKRVIDQYPNININSFAPWKSYAAIYLWKEFAQAMSSKKTEKK